jgi:hypothetical protein
VSDEDQRQKFADVPPFATLCLVTTMIGLIVALLVEAPILVTGSLAGLLAALALYIRRTLG